MFARRTLTWEGPQGVEQKYVTGEVISVLQKEIRRGQPAALFWAQVLWQNGYANAAFNRLKVITIEDASVCVRLAEVVEHCYQAFLKALGGQKLTASRHIPACLQALLRATQALVDAPKSRCLNHALTLQRRQLVDRSDVLTPAQALAAFQQELKNSSGCFASRLAAALRVQIWNDRATCRDLWQAMDRHEPSSTLLPVLERWSKTGNAPLCLAQALVWLSRKDPTLPAFQFSTPPSPPVAVDVSQIQPVLEIPDYALDKHTARGHARKRGVEHFYAVGAQVAHEPFPDPWADGARQWYLELEQSKACSPKSKEIARMLLERWQRALGMPPVTPQTKRKKPAVSQKIPIRQPPVNQPPVNQKPPKRRKPVVDVWSPPCPAAVEVCHQDPFLWLKEAIHTQIPCAWKPPACVGVWNTPGSDVWAQRRVFLKGPVSRSAAVTQQWLNRLKASLHSPVFPLHAMETRVLSWETKFYLLMLDYSAGWTTEPQPKGPLTLTVIKSGAGVECSKIWQAYLRLTPWETIPLALIRQYLAIVLFRHWLGISDTCHRNILQRGDRLWSVDETVMGHPLKDHPALSVGHLTHAFQAQLAAWLQQQRSWCQALLEHWHQANPYWQALPSAVLERWTVVTAQLTE